ncbi:hypothetical protein DFP72DRAFT_860602 [Ephemerocybe angulata]|uniref:Uncharacterized protein n=1 Tax=Ephemerocybe angulata TaxID=980116 RepID=A0A8H6LSP7_9AGAR|nr:hypothetical protein DFP72DRAFT_860602 [Tulosesus angulatus]
MPDAKTSASVSKYHHPSTQANRPATRAVSYSKATQAGLLANPTNTAIAVDPTRQAQAASLTGYGFTAPQPHTQTTTADTQARKNEAIKKGLMPLSQMPTPGSKKHLHSEVSGSTAPSSVPSKKAQLDVDAINTSPDPPELPTQGVIPDKYIAPGDEDDVFTYNDNAELSQARATQGSPDNTSAASSTSVKTEDTNEYDQCFDDVDFDIGDMELLSDNLPQEGKGKGRERDPESRPSNTQQPPANTPAPATRVKTQAEQEDEDLMNAILNPNVPMPEYGGWGSLADSIHAIPTTAPPPEPQPPASPYAVTNTEATGRKPPSIDGKEIIGHITEASRKHAEHAGGKKLYAIVIHDANTVEDIIRGDLVTGGLREYLGEDAIFETSAIECNNPPRDYKGPVPVLVSHMSPENSTKCKERVHFDTAQGSFYILDFDIPITPFIMCFRDLTIHLTEDPKVAAVKVAKMVRDKLATVNTFQFLIAQHGDAMPDVSPKKHGEVALSSIYAEGYEITNKNQEMILIWNIYMTPWTKDTAMHYRFITAIKKYWYLSLGSIKKERQPCRGDWHCNTCKGLDHPTGLCPLLKTPGYIGYNIVNPPRKPQPGPSTGPSPAMAFFNYEDHGSLSMHSPQRGYGNRGRGGRGRGGRGSSRGNYRGGV